MGGGGGYVCLFACTFFPFPLKARVTPLHFTASPLET